MARAHDVGAWGEQLARMFLESCGYLVLDERFRRAGGEIDLVVRKGALVAFVEVKTRAAWSPAPPEAWVGRRKLLRMRATARHWMQEHPEQRAEAYRFDVVAIQRGDADAGAELRHLTGVG